MKCPRCGAINEEDVKFCQNCGAPMEQRAPEDPPEREPAGICAKCGFVNEAGVNFCLNCGAPMNGTQAPSHPKGKRPGKKILIGAICAVILVAAVVVCLKLFQTGNYIAADDSLYTVQVDDEYYIALSDEKAARIEADEDSGCTASRNLANTKAAVFSYDNEALYYFDGGAAVLIAEDVANYAIAAEGDAVVYLIESDDDLYDLFLYSGGRSKKIAGDVGDNFFCISPDGGTVGYVSDIDFEDETCKGYIWDGKAQELGKNKIPFAVSNGGKYVYYVKYSGSDDSGTAYVQKRLKEDTKVKLGDGSEVSSLYFNRDGSEVLLIGNEKTYLCVEGGEREKIASSRCYPIVPYGTRFCNSNGISFVNVKSFQNMYFSSYSSSNYKIIYLNKKNETSTAASNASSFYLSSDGKTVFFLKGDSIRKINGTKSSAEAVTLVEDEVVHFTISADGKTVFFINEDGELYGQEGTKKAKLICDDLDDVYLGQTSIFKGKTIFYISDGELYSSTGEKGTKLSGLSGEVTSVVCDAFAVTVTVDDDGDTIIYRSNDGKNFTILAQY